MEASSSRFAPTSTGSRSTSASGGARWGRSLVNPLLYLAALGVGLGTIVDQSPNAPAAFQYLDYIAPGLLAAAAMQTAATESSWPVMGAIKWTRTYYAMTATPLTRADVLLGHLLFVVTRVLTASARYLAVVAAFGAVNSWLGLLAIPVAVLIGLAFSMPSPPMRRRPSPSRASPPIFRFVIVPMFLFSGTFFPVSQMPAALAAAGLSDADLARGRALPRADARHDRRWPALGHTRLPPRVDDRRPPCGAPRVPTEAPSGRDDPGRSGAQPPRRPGVPLFERNLMSYRRTGRSSSRASSSRFSTCSRSASGSAAASATSLIDGVPIDYAAFVAPGLLAASAMNGAFYDAT